MVLVAPNDSIVKARIKNIRRNSQIYITMIIVHSRDVEGYRNFTRNKIGKEIEVAFKEINESKFTIGKEIDGIHIKYIGDEKGGLYHGKLNANQN